MQTLLAAAIAALFSFLGLEPSCYPARGNRWSNLDFLLIAAQATRACKGLKPLERYPWDFKIFPVRIEHGDATEIILSRILSIPALFVFPY